MLQNNLRPNPYMPVVFEAHLNLCFCLISSDDQLDTRAIQQHRRLAGQHAFRPCPTHQGAHKYFDGHINLVGTIVFREFR